MATKEEKRKKEQGRQVDKRLKKSIKKMDKHIGIIGWFLK
jgi:hypothetical protein